MRTIPLGGKKAAGRVTRVDDGDYDLAMQYAWHVSEQAATATKRRRGPYAVTIIQIDGRSKTVPLHGLITGWALTDHINHDTLDNRRENLREATKRQNGQNSRGHIKRASQFKGLNWNRRRELWQARIVVGQDRYLDLGFFLSEIEAAYAYDAAARDLFGEFACPNFPDGPTQAMRDRWRAERAARDAIVSATRQAALDEGREVFWAQRGYETRTCGFCGKPYQTRAVGISKYCGNTCCTAAGRQRRREREREGRLF